MNKKDIINKLEIIYEYDKNFFDFDRLISDRWREILRDSMKNFKIHFDLENNDTCKIQRIITIPQNYWDHTECKFKCELCRAGGDWEVPVYYFQIQLVSGYCFNDDITNQDKNTMGRMSSVNSMFIFIPGKEEGNYHLVPARKQGEWCAPDNNTYKEGIDPKANEKDCWESLEKYLEKLVEMEIEKIKSEKYFKKLAENEIERIKLENENSI